MDPEVLGEMLEERGLSDEDIDAVLEHAGVKGMKWGVRREKRLQRATRVADGTASTKDKAGFFLTDTSKSAMNRNGGMAGAAAVRAKELSGRKERITSGNAKVSDAVALLGGDRLWISGKIKEDTPVKLGSADHMSLAATQRERKRLVSTGELSQADYNRGTMRFGRNLALGLVGGALTGAALAKAITG